MVRSQLTIGVTTVLVIFLATSQDRGSVNALPENPITNALASILNTLLYGVNDVLPQCITPLQSAQFATVCSLPNTTAAIIPIPAEKSLLYGILNVTADFVCDADCRCIHGALRGGICSSSNLDGRSYCVCDFRGPAYSRYEPEIPYNVECNLVSTFLTTNLCPNQTTSLPIIGSLGSSYACNMDCYCSHGYPNDPYSNHCGYYGPPGNQKVYCQCGNNTNIPDTFTYT